MFVTPVSGEQIKEALWGQVAMHKGCLRFVRPAQVQAFDVQQITVRLRMLGFGSLTALVPMKRRRLFHISEKLRHVRSIKY